MKNILRSFFFLLAILFAASSFTANLDQTPKAAAHDHSEYKELQGPFDSPFKVTEACLACHINSADEIHQTSHWKWQNAENPDLGKSQRSMNNFCIATLGSEPSCSKCHIGYGRKDENFDLTNKSAIDCLVCHDTTNLYKKGGAGMPALNDADGNPKTTLHDVAKAVGEPSRANCGSNCHFVGGGGDGVKHGDLDTSLVSPTRTLDVHMGTDGEDFTCQECHSSEGHQIAGRSYGTPGFDAFKSLTDDHKMSKLSCTSCHSSAPHKEGSLAAKINDHTDIVACQTCHISEFARGGKPTKMRWDWSTAGALKDGKPYEEKDAATDKVIYSSKKGDFTWAENVKPVYAWYDGTMEHLTVDDTIDPSNVVNVNKINGTPRHPRSRIMPFKRHTGKQPYDAKNNHLLLPVLAGNTNDANNAAAFWQHFNWDNALKQSVENIGYDYSGEYGFVETEYFLPITHMVQPKEDALDCNACHVKDGRLESIEAVYIAGQSRVGIVDMLGWIAMLGTLAMVGIHGIMRLIIKKGD